MVNSDAEMAPDTRPAKYGELATVHRMLQAEIETSPFYNRHFKTAEKSRISMHFLRALHVQDPRLVVVAVVSGAVCGCTVAVSHAGMIEILWGLVSRQHRGHQVGPRMLEQMISQFDNSYWHKMACYIRTTNRPSRMLMSNYGFVRAARLEDYMFGEDYDLWQRPLTKADAEYWPDAPRSLHMRARRFLTRWI